MSSFICWRKFHSTPPLPWRVTAAGFAVHWQEGRFTRRGWEKEVWGRVRSVLGSKREGECVRKWEVGPVRHSYPVCLRQAKRLMRKIGWPFSSMRREERVVQWNLPYWWNDLQVMELFNELFLLRIKRSFVSWNFLMLHESWTFSVHLKQLCQIVALID